MVLKIDAASRVPIRTTLTQRPPILTVHFPDRQVLSSLPQRSVIAQGPIRAIIARYDRPVSAKPKRFLRSVQVVLTAPYAFQVKSEPGRIVVELDHPFSVDGTSIEVGLRGGTILEGLDRALPSERFRAMQAALSNTAPGPSPLSGGLPSWTPTAQDQPAMSHRAGGQQGSGAPLPASGVGVSEPAQRRARQAFPGMALAGLLGWGLLAAVMVVGGVIGIRRRVSRRARASLAPSAMPAGVTGELPDGLILIDRLVWQAFEDQGYRLVTETEPCDGWPMPLRIITKDGLRTALGVCSQSAFVEIQHVQAFLQAMQRSGAEQGFLVSTGVLTVPATRYASEHRVTGLGREQLIELLTRGAMREIRGKALKEQQAQAEEAQAALRAALRELEAMRRQRNEASWALGEERARSAKLDTQLAAQQAVFAQQLQDRDVQLAQGEARLADLRKQWEEGEWYLGESRERARHVEAQLTALQETAARLAEVERQRDEAQWYLGEERTQRAALQAEVDELKRRHGQEERRLGARVRVPQVQIEVYNGEEEPIFSGSPCDMSHSGVRLESDEGFPERESVRVRLSVPGYERIESRAQLRWRRFPSDRSPRYQSGYQLVELPGDARAVIEQVIAESVAAGGAPS